MEELKVALTKKWRGFFEREYSEIVESFRFTTPEERVNLDRRLLVSPQIYRDENTVLNKVKM